MASWYSNLVTKTSSQISSLRSTLLSSEADGDTEDDTHVCRVLRNYYTDKGRPLPPWLPPDPKAPQQAPVQPIYSQPQVGSRYGGLGGQNNAQGGGGGGLSSLWDSNPGANQAQAPQSLRAGRGVGSAPPAMSPMGGRPGNDSPAARPMQSMNSGGSGGAAGAGSSAQDRLRQRLWGGARTTSPSQGSQGQGPFQPPSSGGSSGGGGGGGGGNYEDRFAPGGSYDSGRRGGGGNDPPYVGANSPWSTGGDDFGGGGGYGGGGGGGGGGSSGRPAPPQGGGPGRRMGLPSGPRGYR